MNCYNPNLSAVLLIYAKHAIYYDKLPHYFMEFDIFDRETGRFLDTPSRHELIKGLPLCSVPVLAEENGCLDAPVSFASDLTRRAYFQGRDVLPQQELYDETWGRS